jgi:hypothetical protein
MGIIDSIGNLVMKSRIEDLENAVNNPQETQEKVLSGLINTAKDTVYGREFKFREIRKYRQFREQVPLADYEICCGPLLPSGLQNLRVLQVQRVK